MKNNAAILLTFIPGLTFISSRAQEEIKHFTRFRHGGFWLVREINQIINAALRIEF